MYSVLLTQGKRNDIARFVNATLLSQDWPLIRNSLEPRLRRWCERQFALGGRSGGRSGGAGGDSGTSQASG